MTRHRMRLVEQLIEEDSGDFVVEAPTPALAVDILLTAHNRAREQCSNVVALPDRQTPARPIQTGDQRQMTRGP